MADFSAPAAKAGLLALLGARAALDDVQQTWDDPLDSRESESIHLGGETRIDTEWGPLGQGRLEEEFTFEVFVTVGRQGTDVQGTEERVWELVAEVMDTIRDDLTLNGAVKWCRVEGAAMQNLVAPEGSGWASQAVLTVNCRNRI